MKIFAAGLATETNTFSPIPTSIADFTTTRARDLDIEHPDFGIWGLFGGWRNAALAQGDEFVFSLMAFAQPAGITVRSAYELLRNEIIADLCAAGTVDVVLLNLHGAMIAHGYDCCEEDFIGRVRDQVGGDTVIAVELDLHCHLSAALLAHADIVITYKEYPHVDVNARAVELFDLAMRTKRREIRPTMALFDCRMMGLYPTSNPAMRGFVTLLAATEKRERVLSVSLVHGFPWGDVPHGGTKVLVVTDDDPALAQALASQLGRELFARRYEIGFDSRPMHEALTLALAQESTPVVVADQSDNAGAGAPADATFALRWLLEHRASDVAMAIFYDPQVVKIAKAAGAGATAKVRLRGKMGTASGDPLDLEVRVLAIKEDYWHPFPQQTGPPTLWPLGDIVALSCAGIDIVVSSERSQCFCPSIFTDCGIDPTKKRLLVLKSFQHFYGAFAPIAARVIYMAAPGAVVPIIKQIPYERFDITDRFPWADEPGSLK